MYFLHKKTNSKEFTFTTTVVRMEQINESIQKTNIVVHLAANKSPVCLTSFPSIKV